MAEKNCVYNYVQRCQRMYDQGRSLSEVLETAPTYQAAVRKFYGERKFLTRPGHGVVTSMLGLSTIAAYEYARHKLDVLPLPDTNEILQSLFVLVFLRRALCNGQSPQLDRQSLVENYLNNDNPK